MYTKENKIIVSNETLDNYIEGSDIFNSSLLSKLSDQSLNRDYYEITSFEYRPDLIAEDFYGSANYLGILMIQTRLSLNEFSKGRILKLITREQLDKILDSYY